MTDLNQNNLADTTVSAFIFQSDTFKLRVLDQTLLPKTIKYVDVPDTKAAHDVIKSMKVRGAPCIAAVGCLSLIAEMNQVSVKDEQKSSSEFIEWLSNRSEYLITSRPTAVNLKKALEKMIAHAKDLNSESVQHLIAELSKLCIDAIEGGKCHNRQLGDHGADLIIANCTKESGVSVLTHCNTGALATVGYGTALGVIRSLRNKGRLERAYCTETRPYNQGSRLTAWELTQENITSTLIADSMAAYLMATRQLDAVIVGADCVVANGDTANKIGTLQLAVLAKHFSVPFYVAAPTQSIDLTRDNQSSIQIEQRPAREMRYIESIALAPEEIEVWNPCFDITPGSLITGIITEWGVCKPDELRNFMSQVDAFITNNEGVHALF